MVQSKPLETPDSLLTHLLGVQETITYAAAYEAMVGPRMGKWSQGYALQVTTMARTSRFVKVQGLEIQLDALVVNGRAGRPGPTYYEGKKHALDAWLKVFGQWERCLRW